MREKKMALQGAIITVTVVTAYLLGRILDLGSRPLVVKSEMAVLMAVMAIWYVYQHRNGNVENKINIILLGAMVMRIGYMLYTQADVRGHDLWEMNVEGLGHAGYLLRIMEKHQLPESNALQLYQQPFYYFIGALFSKLIHLVLPTEEKFYLVDAAKTVSCVASCMSLFVYRDILEECGLEKEGVEDGMLLIAFLPAFYLTGGRVGVDALAALFLLLVFLYTLRFRKQPNWKNLLVLAVVYGLGVMTKISCAVLAPITIFVFLEKLFMLKTWKKRGTLLFKYVIFGVISLPLGLWYSVRNYILFRQPLTYVLRQNDNSQLYTGMYSIPERIFGINIKNLLETPYAKVTEDYNAPVYYIKSALFGEFTYRVPGMIPAALLWCSVILSAVVLVAFIWQLTKCRADREGKLAAIVFLICYGSALFFYLQYPHGCSMDFRYMLFLTAPAGVLFAKYLEEHTKVRRGIYPVLWGTVVFSCIFYCMI